MNLTLEDAAKLIGMEAVTQLIGMEAEYRGMPEIVNNNLYAIIFTNPGRRGRRYCIFHGSEQECFDFVLTVIGNVFRMTRHSELSPAGEIFGAAVEDARKSYAEGLKAKQAS